MLQKIVITQAKRTPEREWLADVSNIPLQQSIADLGVAYKNYFESRNGFRVLVEAKSEKFNRKFVVLSRWEPTSQVCSTCGSRWGKLDLSVRTITCLKCGTAHNRDENAARNIEKVGIEHCHDAKCTQRVGKTGLPARPVEA